MFKIISENLVTHADIAQLERDLIYIDYRRDLLECFVNYRPRALPPWARGPAHDLGQPRLDARVMDLLRSCCTNEDPVGMDLTTRFWIAVYLRLTTRQSFSVLARRFNISRPHLVAAIQTRAMPNACLYFTPVSYVRMLELSNLIMDEHEIYANFFSV